MSTRYNTGNSIESTDVRDMSDNAKNFDDFANSKSNEFTDRFGVERKTIHGMNSQFDSHILNMGFTRVGTFAAGATLTNPRQTLLWDIADGGDGQEYGWSGSFPKVVPALSTPASTGGIAVGAWISRFDPELRVQVREALRRSYSQAGYNLVAGSFEAGGTITTATDSLIYEAEGRAYSWGGTLPKTVSSGSTPASSGGVAAGAWQSQHNAMTQASRVGYKNPASLVSEAVSDALDKINMRLIYAIDFGVKVDGSDNDDALYALGEFLSTYPDPCYVIFPRGVSLVGSQQLAGATGLGYSWRPKYQSRAWADPSAMGWFSVHNTNNKIILDFSGWTLKLNSGMKIGAYDPVTGAVAPGQISETPNADFLASSGYLIKIYLAPNVEIHSGASDGNLTGASWGGKYGNDGYQVPSYNMWVNQSEGVRVKKHTFKNSPVDGLYMQATGSRSFLDIIPLSTVEDCIWQDCGRNCWSLTGGGNIDIINPVITRSGRKATGIGTHYSGPEAGLNIEAEGGNPYGIRIVNPKIVDTGKNALMTVAVPGTVNDITVEGGVLHSWSEEGAITNTGASRNIKFKGTVIIGSVIDANSPTPMAMECYSFENCEFMSRYGATDVPSYKLNFRVSKFTGNTITFAIPSVNVTTATLNITDQDGVALGLYAERFKQNRLIVYGDAAKITFVNGLGGLNNFKNAELFVNSAGLTGGTTKLLVDTCSAGLNGLSTNTTNFTFNTTMDKDLGRNIWYARKPSRAAGGLVAASASGAAVGQLNIGDANGRFATGYFDTGIIVRDGVAGTHYRIRVTSGSLNIVADET